MENQAFYQTRGRINNLIRPPLAEQVPNERVIARLSEYPGKTDTVELCGIYGDESAIRNGRAAGTLVNRATGIPRVRP